MNRPESPAPEPAPLARLRWLVLALLTFGMFGTGIDLRLLDLRGRGDDVRGQRQRIRPSRQSLGVVDANSAAEKDLPGMPHMTPAIVKGLVERGGTTPQFDKEIGKYVGAKDAERMWRYVVID